MSRLPMHTAHSHAWLREQLFDAAKQWFPDYAGPGGWDPSATGSSADRQSAPGLSAQAEDLGRGLLDAYALALHVLWTYQEAWADEGFLSLARLDSSVDRLLSRIGYRPGPGTAAVGLQHFHCVPGVSGILPAGFRVGSPARGEEPEAGFETLHPLRLNPALNELRAWAGPTTAQEGNGSDGSAGQGSGSSSGGTAGTNGGAADGGRPGAATADVPRIAPIADALKDRLAAGAGGDLAARQAARARVEMRQLTDMARRLEAQGVEQCEGAREALCQELCATQQQLLEQTAAPGPVSESQEIALRQLARLAQQQTQAIAALEAALARCEAEAETAYRERLDAMAAFLDAFVAGLVQDARDKVVLLRGPRALARLDQAFGGNASASALGNAAPGSDSLYLIALDNGRISAGTFDMLQPGDWLVLAEDQERVDDEGRPERRRLYREAIRVVAVNHERVPGYDSRFTRIRFEPRLRRRYRLDRVVLLGNNARISEGVSVEESGALNLDGRTLDLSHSPLTWLRDAQAAGGRRPECRVWIDDEEWTRSDRLFDAAPTERLFAVESKPGGGARLRFGDARNGAPVPGGADIRLRYRIGLGTAGNRDSLRVEKLNDAHPAVESTFNPLPLSGGSPAESQQAAKVSAPAALRAMDRAVSLADVRALALTFDGVGRAEAGRGARRGEIRVRVCAPDGGPLADLAGLRAFLQARVAPGVRILADNAHPVPTFVDILLRLDAGADPLAVMAAARLRLGVDQADDAPPGLLHPERIALDRDLRLSEVYGALDGVPGLSSCLVRRFYRQALDAEGAPLPLSPDQRRLSQRVEAAADELLVWAPPQDGEDGVRLSFEPERDR